MKTNLESRYLFLKRFTAYYPSTIFLRKSILKIAKKHEITTIRGLIFTTNRVIIFLIISSCIISIIEAIYFFTTEKNETFKFQLSSIIYVLNLDFNLLLLIKFIFRLLFRLISKSFRFFNRLINKLRILYKSISIRSTISFSKIFFARVGKNTVNILVFPVTSSAFVFDKFLEPIEIRWFYRSLPISQDSPFFFN